MAAFPHFVSLETISHLLQSVAMIPVAVWIENSICHKKAFLNLKSPYLSVFPYKKIQYF